ncbi:MAG: class I SAM-dependent methyltransferase [Pirellulales bacterium]
MASLKRLSGVMEHPTAYRLWQSPFVRAKFAPVLRHNDLSKVRRVLDVGCGPGTNAALFEKTDYVGLDINESYVRTARRRHGREFITADACTYEAAADARFDFILLNSLLHHIDTANVERILRQLGGQLTDDGHVHVLELVLPEERGLPRLLARSDRGDFPRSLEHWRELFTAQFAEVVFEPFTVGRLGIAFFEMVYFKGRARR